MAINKKGSNKSYKGLFAGIIALLLVVVFLAGAIGWGSEGFKNWNVGTWFNSWGRGEQQIDKPDNPNTPDNPDDDNNNGDQQIPVGGVVKHNASFVATTYSMDESLISLASEALSEDIMTTAEGGFTLTASVYPADADNKAVNWTVSWDNPNASWAQGKTVTDYVTITPTSAGSLTATANCKAAFGEKIKITVTSQDNPEATAICICDYVKRITGLTFTAGELYFPSTGYSYTVETSAYTLDSTVAVTIGNKMTLEADFVSAIISKYSNSTYRYNSDWWFNADKSAAISTDYNSKKITFNSATKDFANCFTYPDDEYSSSEIKEMNSYINSAFRSAVSSYSGVHATFTVTYTAVYNGTTYTSGSKTVECRFNYTSLKVPVGSLALNLGGIIF